MKPARTVQPSSPVAALQQALAELVRRDLPIETFTAEWLRRLLEAVGAGGGRLRRPAADGTLGIVAALGLPREPASGGDTPTEFERAILEVYSSGQARIIPLASSS